MGSADIRLHDHGHLTPRTGSAGFRWTFREVLRVRIRRRPISADRWTGGSGVVDDDRPAAAPRGPPRGLGWIHPGVLPRLLAFLVPDDSTRLSPGRKPQRPCRIGMDHTLTTRLGERGAEHGSNPVQASRRDQPAAADERARDPVHRPLSVSGTEAPHPVMTERRDQVITYRVPVHRHGRGPYSISLGRQPELQPATDSPHPRRLISRHLTELPAGPLRLSPAGEATATNSDPTVEQVRSTTCTTHRHSATCGSDRVGEPTDSVHCRMPALPVDVRTRIKRRHQPVAPGLRRRSRQREPEVRQRPGQTFGSPTIRHNPRVSARQGDDIRHNTISYAGCLVSFGGL